MESLAGHGVTNLVQLLGVALVAGLARGFSGFGAALIFVPLASAIVGPRLAVPVLLVIDAVAAAGMIPNGWRLADRREVAIMSVGALAGVPLGTLALANMDAQTLRWAIILVVVALLVLLMSGWRYHGRTSAPLTVAVGAIAGVFSGAAQTGGPPVVAYWLGGAAGHQKVRANIVLYFAVATVFSIASYLWNGLIGADVLWLSLLTGPVFGLGLYAGSRIFGLADEDVFRRICFALIAAAVVLGLPLWDSLRA